jgi:predicted ATPase
LAAEVDLPKSLPVPFISRVRLRNFKSIADCDVRLGPLSVLVGSNGAGKSNFLDALRFVAQAVASDPDRAIAMRGGLGEILHRGRVQAESFSVDLEVTVPWGATPEQWARGRYGFEIAAADRPGRRPFLVRAEHCLLGWQDREDGFTVREGLVQDRRSPVSETAIDQERLYLPLAGARPNLAPLYVALRGMYFYDPDPNKLRELHPQTVGAALGPAGENLGDVLGALDPPTKSRFDAYMRAVVPELASVERKFEGSYVTVELRTEPGDGQRPQPAFGPNATAPSVPQACWPRSSSPGYATGASD